MAKIKYKAEIELEITDRVLEKTIKFEESIQARYQDRFEEMHKYLNSIMDSMVMYDKDTLKMAEAAIDRNRFCATEARKILRSMMK